MKAPIARGGTALLVGLLFSVVAAGQDAATLKELKEWHDKLVKPDLVATPELGQQAREKIKNWSLSVGSLSPEARGQLVRLEIYAALAAGDAAAAVKALPDLEMDFPAARETLDAAYLAATAAGDAQRTKATLEKLRDLPGADAKLISVRLRQLRTVGEPAPDQKLKTEDGRETALRERAGAVLVVDLWRAVPKPADADVKAIVSLYEPYLADLKVQFLGINSDGPGKVPDARKFASDRGYVWPQYYEKKTAAPLTEKEFPAGAPPWTVVIDGGGNVRAVGAATDPALHYALRAAAAEAGGRFAAMRPKTTAGREASAAPKPAAATPEPKKEAAAKPGEATPGGRQPGEGETGQAKPGDKKSGEGDTGRAKPKGELPSNPEAKALLDRARLYMKTGKKTEAKKLLQQIVEQYPGTREAREAEELLQYM